MSHSQFHHIDLFILRHAWLNLWDKHMTTGRINQVTYVRAMWGGLSCATTIHPPLLKMGCKLETECVICFQPALDGSLNSPIAHVLSIFPSRSIIKIPPRKSLPRTTLS